MENEKRMYTCAVCGKQYDNIKDRMNCERKCIEELTKKNEEAEKAKTKAEKAAKEQEINDIFNRYYDLLNDYINKYKEYLVIISNHKSNRYYDHSNDNINNNMLNPLLNNFWLHNFF